MKKSKINFIDLFAGIGGTRIGFENACRKNGITPNCVFTSEIKSSAIKVYQDNFGNEKVYGDITKIKSENIPDFDFLLAGFPCQPFSAAGNRNGFLDTRGTLFFEIERILRDKNPYGFLLENVEGLVNHDKVKNSDPMGKTLLTILTNLEELGYKINWKVLDASKFGVPQSRKRIYIVGTKDMFIDLNGFEQSVSRLHDILEKGVETPLTEFAKTLLHHYEPRDLLGKSIKDKRGGKENIHSWDIELKGSTTDLQRQLLSLLLKERRKKHWAQKKQIIWMDGMPLTLDEIYSFFNIVPKSELKELLEDLVSKKYLRFEYPKDIVEEDIGDGKKRKVRKYADKKEKGYNIVAGKLSFPISKILSPNHIAPTLVATDVDKLAVVDNNKLRKLTIREGLRLFGYPEEFKLDINYKDATDLLGNTVVVRVIEIVSMRFFNPSTTKSIDHDSYFFYNPQQLPLTNFGIDPSL